jgi:phytol kinase
MTAPALAALLPDPTTAVLAGGAGLGLAWGVGTVAARLRARGVRVPYTRKLFHFGIFTGAAVVHALGGLPATNAFGAAVAAWVLLAVLGGEGHLLYEALARDTDRPHRTLFILVPLATTAVGGLLSALLAGPFAAVGYVVAGWGDAVGEPVGARWGHHPYRVPSLGGVSARRTGEGSAAVFAAGAAAAWVALVGLGVPTGTALLVAPAVAAAATAVEAVSHHGTDNLTVQLAASLVALALAG